MRNLYLALLRYKDLLALVVTVTLSLSLILSGNSHDVVLLRARANNFLAYLYRPVSRVRNILVLEEETNLLREQNLQLTLELATLRQAELENQNLRELLQFQRQSNFNLVPARVISKGLTPTLTALTIDVGQSAGVQANQPVLTPAGVVGKTILVSKSSSLVQVCSDLNFRLSVRILPSGATGILRWQNGERYEVREIQKNVLLQVGDPVVTSGFSDIYPPNLPLGEVVGIVDERGSYQKIVQVQINQSLGSLTNVFVLLRQSAGKLRQLEDTPVGTQVPPTGGPGSG